MRLDFMAAGVLPTASLLDFSIGVSARATAIEDPIVNPANGHAYYLISTPSWPQAEAEAISLGGHLVTIRSADETRGSTRRSSRDVLRSAAAECSNPWIGFSDAANEGTLVWSSGEPVTYTNWKVGEPHHLNGEDYARFDFGRGWNDVPSTSENTRHGIVEVVPEPSTGLLLVSGLAWIGGRRSGRDLRLRAR